MTSFYYNCLQIVSALIGNVEPLKAADLGKLSAHVLIQLNIGDAYWQLSSCSVVWTQYFQNSQFLCISLVKMYSLYNLSSDINNNKIID